VGAERLSRHRKPRTGNLCASAFSHRNCSNAYLNFRVSSAVLIHCRLFLWITLKIICICALCLKGQMQRNLDNFSFVEKPLKKSQLYHHEAESTPKNKFCATCGAQDTENRRFPRASRKRTRNGRAGVKTKLYVFVTSYLASSFSLPYNFLEIIGLFQGLSWRLLTSRCIK